jgi:putative AlgH/UPF0301 family transcriptional regulator
MLIYRKNIGKKKDHPSAASFYYNGILDTMLLSSNFYRPHVAEFSLTEFLRKEFRSRDTVVGSVALPDRLDVSLLYMKKLSTTWKSFSGSSKESHKNRRSIMDTKADAEKTETKTVASRQITKTNTNTQKDNTTSDAAQRYLGRIKASITLNLTPGTLLIAHPLVSGPLHRSVVLLLEHSVDNGSYGIVINRRTDHTISSAVKNLPHELVQVFGGNRVHFGGMVRRLQYIHDVPDCGGIPIPMCEKRSLFAGGQIGKVVSFVQGDGSDNRNHQSGQTIMGASVGEDGVGEKAGTSNVNERAKSVQFFVGCCAWDARALEEELSSGYWIPVIAKPDMLLEYAAAFDAATSNVHINSDRELAISSTTSPSSPSYSSTTAHRQGRHDVGNMWSNVIASLGPQFADAFHIPTHIAISNVEPVDF